MSRTIAVIDGNSLMHRAFHAVPPTMNAPDGTPTNAVFGFMSMLIKFIEVAHPDGIVCAFDEGRPKFRMEALEQYKAQRPPMDDDLRVQFPLIESLLTSMEIPVVRVKGWEGDDILGTIAARDEDLDYKTLLVTGDKDAYQLATDRTQIVTTKKGITDVALYGPEEVKERYGITPEQVPDFLGLKGDSSDNIPGVPGIGEKGAAKLLQQFGSLEGIYDNLDKLKGKQLENVRDNKEAAFASRKVATIVRDLDFPLEIEKVRFPAFDQETVSKAFGELRFSAHLNKVLSFVGASPVRTHQAALEVPDHVEGTEAFTLLENAIKNDEQIGVALVQNEQASLFGGDYVFAISTSEGVALFEDAAVEKAFETVVRQASFATLNVKSLIQYAYPADTSQAAFLTEQDLMTMRAFDLGLAGYILDSSSSTYRMADLMEKYADSALPETKNLTDEAAAEALAARILVDTMKQALEKDNSERPYYDIDLPLVAVLTIVERTGTVVDVDFLSELGTQTQKELNEISAQIIDMAGSDFNLDSPKQLSHVLFDVLGLKPTKKTKSGYSTDASVLKELAKDHELPVLILRYRELAKIKSTYIDALPKMRAGDGRIHTNFNETVTTTGRLSSSEPNLQNIPVRTEFGRQIRKSFLPLDEGSVFLSADYSQIELRLLAHLSNDQGLIDAFSAGTDFHAQTAARVFDIDVDKVTPDLRSKAKAVNFGIVYGQQAFGLSQSLDIPFGEAKDMIDRYFEIYPGVRNYLDQTIEDAKRTGYATTLFDRKRHIPELKMTNAQRRAFGERTAMNHPMQGSAADIIKLAMTKVQEKLLDEGLKTKLLLQVHDELDFSVPQNEVDVISALVKDIMENIVELRVKLIVDVESGENWEQAH